MVYTAEKRTPVTIVRRGDVLTDTDGKKWEVMGNERLGRFQIIDLSDRMGEGTVIRCSPMGVFQKGG